MKVHTFVPQKHGVFDFEMSTERMESLTLKMSTKSMKCLTLKCHNPFKNKNSKKATHSLLPVI